MMRIVVIDTHANRLNCLVIDGKKSQSMASLWRMKQEHKGEEYFDLERMHQHQSRGELELVLTLDVGDGSAKKYVLCPAFFSTIERQLFHKWTLIDDTFIFQKGHLAGQHRGHLCRGLTDLHLGH